MNESPHVGPVSDVDELFFDEGGMMSSVSIQASPWEMFNRPPLDAAALEVRDAGVRMLDEDYLIASYIDMSRSRCSVLLQSGGTIEGVNKVRLVIIEGAAEMGWRVQGHDTPPDAHYFTVLLARLFEQETTELGVRIPELAGWSRLFTDVEPKLATLLLETDPSAALFVVGRNCIVLSGDQPVPGDDVPAEMSLLTSWKSVERLF